MNQKGSPEISKQQEKTCLSTYLYRASQVALVVKNLPANAGDTEMQVRFLGWEGPLKEEMATQSNILAWRIPWAEKPGRLQSIGSQSRT